MLDILATFLRVGLLLIGKSVTLYVDNSNWRDALMRGSSDTGIVQKMVQIFWRMARDLGISVWTEYVPSGINISDLPTRHV